MIRTLDPGAFAAIAEHPEVKPWLGFADPKAPATLEAVANPANFAFLTEAKDGGYIYVRHLPGLYSAHTLALPSARGRPMLRLMQDSLRALFTTTDASEIATAIPQGNDKAARWSDAAGFSDTFRRPLCFPLMGETVDVQFRSLPYQKWVLTDPRNATLGRFFHERLDKASAHSGHPDDTHHDAWVGATIAGCMAGLTTKAIALFNAYALVAGYHPATILSTAPPTIFTGDAIVELRGGELAILRSRGEAS